MTKRILEEIRVLDFSVVWAGPYAARMLAEMGAEVIHVEHPRLFGHVGVVRVGSSAKAAKALGMTDVDPNSVGEAPWRGVRDTYTSVFSANKRFIALDTTSPEGGKILNELLKISDVLIENLTPDVAKKLGIYHEQVRQANPRLICCAIRGFGDGLWANHLAYGSTLEYLSGLTSLTGYEEGDRPMAAGVFMVDPIGAMQGVAAIISGLMYRKRTGEGISIESSQYEAATSFVNEAIMDYTMNKRVRIPTGNNDKDIAFQGCYPAKGSDQWIVLSIRNQVDWSKLCGIIRKKDWLNDKQYNEPSRLEAKREEVDTAISAWTIGHSKEDIARFLQNSNIPAAPVNNTAEAIFYPPLRHRRLYKWVEHSYGAIAPIPSMPVNFTRTPSPEVYHPAGAVGADNHYVYGELLGLTESRIKELEDKKIIKR